MKEFWSFLSIVAVVVILIASPHLFRQLTADNDSVSRQVDSLNASVQTLIDAEQSRLGSPVVVADPFKHEDMRKVDINVRLQYLAWKIEVAIMLQRINSGKSPGKPSGMSIVSPVGQSFGSAEK